MARIPEDDDWRDHAIPCPNCDQPVLREDAHFHPATEIDPGWYGCDAILVSSARKPEPA